MSKEIFVITIFSLLLFHSHALKDLRNEDGTEFDIEWSKKMNVYSAVTNCNDYQISNWACKICSKVEKPIDIQVISNTVANLKGFVGYLPFLKKIIVSFRGTRDAKNWA